MLLNFKKPVYVRYLKDKGYTSIKYVGDVGIDEKNSDVENAEYCIKHNCDFITADKGALDEIFTGLKKVKSIVVILILEKELANNASPVYSLSFRTVPIF